jgi:membrane protease YdiL (CAAX protease family)
MNNLSSRKFQRGYLLEIPILLVVVIVVLAVLLPNLRPGGQKFLIAIASVPILFALFYMIVTPGWTPSNKARLRPPWNWLVFLLVAIPIVAVLVMIFLG